MDKLKYFPIYIKKIVLINQLKLPNPRKNIPEAAEITLVGAD